MCIKDEKTVYPIMKVWQHSMHSYLISEFSICYNEEKITYVNQLHSSWLETHPLGNTYVENAMYCWIVDKQINKTK